MAKLAGRAGNFRILILGCLAATFACASAAAQSAGDVLLYKGPDRQERLVEGAKREGRLVLYSGMIVNQALRPIVAAFEHEYPFIETTFWRGNSEDLMAKYTAEFQAHDVVGDVLEGAEVGARSVEGGFAQAMWSPEFAAIPAGRRDPNGLWAPTRMNYFSLAYNTKLVSKASVPKSYDDLLDPRWKGKMAWPVGAATGAPLFVTNLRMAWGEQKARAYLERLARQKIINFGSGSARALVDRVIAGDYPIALQIYAHHPLISANKGAPVAAQLLAPTPSTSSTMVVPKGTKHIHAAMLFVDFILSKQGQETLAKVRYLPVRSDVDPVGYITAIVPAHAGVPEQFINPEKLDAMNPSSEKIVEDLFR